MASSMAPAIFENQSMLSRDLHQDNSSLQDNTSSSSLIDATSFSMFPNQLPTDIQELYSNQRDQSGIEKLKSPTVCIEELSWNVNKVLETNGSLKLSSSPPSFTITKSPSPSTTTITTTSLGISLSPKPTRTFKIGDLVWGAVRGAVAWPGKIVNGPDGEPTSSDCVWVKWYGERRQHTEMVLTNKLQSLSEGLEAHHAAQKDSRK